MTPRRHRLPVPAAPAPAADAFVRIIPPEVTAEEEAMRQEVYAWAKAEAEAVVRPSLPERDLLGVWN